MASIQLTLPNPINIALQAKPTNVATTTGNIDNGAWDVIYFVRTETVIDANGVKIMGERNILNILRHHQTLSFHQNFLKLFLIINS